MAKKFTLRSANYNTLIATLASIVVAGEYVVSNNIVGFCLVDGAVPSGASEYEHTLVVGAEMVEVEKATGQAWAPGEPVYWDATAENCTTTFATNVLVGFVHRTAAVAATEGIICFDGKIAYLKTA